VFAIVITLLVLEIRVPDLTSGQRLAKAISEIRPSLVAFLISFFAVAIAWIGHRDLFAFIRLTDTNLVWLNVLYMLPLTLFPFGGALISRASAAGRRGTRLHLIQLVKLPQRME
jgi:uncharacterized membrane protein